MSDLTVNSFNKDNFLLKRVPVEADIDLGELTL